MCFMGVSAIVLGLHVLLCLKACAVYILMSQLYFKLLPLPHKYRCLSVNFFVGGCKD